MERQFVINPLTNRKVMVGSRVYMGLIRSGVIVRREETTIDSTTSEQEESNTSTKRARQASTDIYIHETLTLCCLKSFNIILKEHVNTKEAATTDESSEIIAKSAALYKRVKSTVDTNSQLTDVKGCMKLGRQLFKIVFEEMVREPETTNFSKRCVQAMGEVGLYWETREKDVRIGHRQSRVIVDVPIKIDNNIHFKEDSFVWPTPQNEAMYATMDTLDDRKELPDWKRFYTTDGQYCFDVLFLVKLLADQLNSQKSLNPYPQYPNNPFTRDNFSKDELTRLRLHLQSNQLQISPVLFTFLNAENEIWTENTEETQSYEWKQRCIRVFDESLRYMRLYNGTEPDGSLMLTCAWVQKNTEPKFTEPLVLEYMETMDPFIHYILEKQVPYVSFPNSYYYKDVLEVPSHYEKIPI